MIILVLEVFARFFIVGRLTESADAATTISNIANSEALFRISIAAFIVICAADVVVA